MGGAKAAAAPSTSSVTPGQVGGTSDSGVPRPLSASAGAMRSACRAGTQPPTSADAVPSSPNTATPPASTCSGGTMPGK